MEEYRCAADPKMLSSLVSETDMWISHLDIFVLDNVDFKENLNSFLPWQLIFWTSFTFDWNSWNTIFNRPYLYFDRRSDLAWMSWNMKLNSLSSLNLTECDESWQRRLVRPLPPLAGAVLGINQHSSSSQQPAQAPSRYCRYCRYYWVLELTTSAATHRYISTFLFLPWQSIKLREPLL